MYNGAFEEEVSGGRVGFVKQTRKEAFQLEEQGALRVAGRVGPPVIRCREWSIP